MDKPISLFSVDPSAFVPYSRPECSFVYEPKTSRHSQRSSCLIKASDWVIERAPAEYWPIGNLQNFHSLLKRILPERIIREAILKSTQKWLH